MLTQGHGLITESGHCCPTGLPASNTRHHLSESERKDPSSTQLSSVPMESQMEELTTRCPLSLLLERVMLHGWRCSYRQRDHFASPRLLFGQKAGPARSWVLGLQFRGQRDPTMTKDLVPGKALSCVGY